MENLPASNLKSVQLAGTELHYVEVGTGPPVVLAHGGFADYRLWGNLSSLLSQSFRVISYSRRGAYPNALPNEGSAISLHSADLASFISELSDKPVHLVGESLGAYVTLHCAIHHPEKVRSLAIDEPPILSLLPANEDDVTELERFRREALNRSLDLYSAGREEDAARVIIDYLEGSAGVYDSLPNEAKEGIRANSHATLGDLKKGLGGIEQGDLDRLRSPVLLMKSTLGPKLLRRVVDRLKVLIPSCEFREIWGSSHGTIVDSPEYSAAVLEFLRKN